MTLTIQPSLFDAPAAEAAAEAGMARAERNADEEWRAGVENAIRLLADSGRTFTADDVRALSGDPPAGTHPNASGALMNRAARLGLIRMVGFARSSRVVGHNNTIRLWTQA